jgi:hypothetical protein
MNITVLELKLFTNAQLIRVLEGTPIKEVCRKIDQIKLIGTPYEEHIDYSKIAGHDWIDLIREQPQYTDKVQWSKLDGSDWWNLLQYNPEYAVYAGPLDWAKIPSRGIGCLLYSQPHFLEHFDLSEMAGPDWFYLLYNRPKFAEHANPSDWLKLTDKQWTGLLSIHPQFSVYRPAKKASWLSNLFK